MGDFSKIEPGYFSEEISCGTFRGVWTVKKKPGELSKNREKSVSQKTLT